MTPDPEEGCGPTGGSSERAFRRVAGMPWRWSETTVLVAAGEDEYREMGGLASPVWVMLDGVRSAASIADEMRQVLKKLPPRLEERVAEALSEMVAAGVVETVDPPDAASGKDRSGATVPVDGSTPVEVTAEGPDDRVGAKERIEATDDDPVEVGSETGGLTWTVWSEDLARSTAFGGSDPVEAALRILMADELPGAPGFDTIEVPEDRTAELVARVVGSRSTGSLLWGVQSGQLELPGSAEAMLREAHRGALLWCLHLEHRLLDLLEELDGDGIVPIVLKGPAVAHLDRSDPGLRTFADLDLLVRPHDLDRVVEIVTRRGGQRPWPERRPGFDRRFAKSVTLRLPDGVEVDLHRNLCDGVHGFRVPPEELHAAPTVFDLAGLPVRALRLEHRVLSAAYHAVLGSARPMPHSLRDLAGHLTDPAVDPLAIAGIARRWRGTEVLATAVDETLSAVAIDAPAWRAWREEVRLDPVELSTIAGQRDDGSSLGRGRLAALRELPSRADQMAFLAAVLWPSAAHLDARGSGRIILLRRLAARLRDRSPQASGADQRMRPTT